MPLPNASKSKACVPSYFVDDAFQIRHGVVTNKLWNGDVLVKTGRNGSERFQRKHDEVFSTPSEAYRYAVFKVSDIYCNDMKLLKENYEMFVSQKVQR